MVYAAGTEPLLLNSVVLEVTLGVLIAGLVVLIGWGTWVGVGRTVRPVEQIGSALSDITDSDLSRRVPVPPGSDELSHLARVANQTLDRLETAMRRQPPAVQLARSDLWFRPPGSGRRNAADDHCWTG